MSDYRHMAWPLALALPGLVDELKEGSVFGNGVLKDVPTTRPFVIVKLGERMEEMVGGHAHSQPFMIYAHDDPGSFTVIDKILKAFKNSLISEEASMYHWPRENPLTNDPWAAEYEAEKAIGVRWMGDSRDLADDYYGTLVRYSTWQCMGAGA